MWTEQLSIVGDDTTGEVAPRPHSRCLRPIFINGVEVGYAHVQAENPGKRLSVRGITIALWYFISRGHQAQALLPFCFKTYPNKSDGWHELMALYRMNLIEFTPGCGSDKYVEVNRIVALRAREYGGCLVARSQMHSIIEDHPFLESLIEKRLLMPSFNGNDLIFPLDGPLGRIGPSLSATLECSASDAEWNRCTTQQMKLRDQLFWLNALSLLVPSMGQWSALVGKVRDVQPRGSMSAMLSEQLNYKQCTQVTHFELHPPETNPVCNRGFSVFKRHRWIHDSIDNNNNGVSSSGELVAEQSARNDNRYRNPPRMSYGTFSGEFRSHKHFRDQFGSQLQMNGNNMIRRVNRPEVDYDERTYSGLQGGTSRGKVFPSEEEKPVVSKCPEQSQHFSKLAAIFGYQKAKAVCDKNPNLNNLCTLAELVLEEDDLITTSQSDEATATTKQGQQEPQQQQSEQSQSEDDRMASANSTDGDSSSSGRSEALGAKSSGPSVDVRGVCDLLNPSRRTPPVGSRAAIAIPSDCGIACGGAPLDDSIDLIEL